jgi:carbon-monoxide dehydrogenase medium subunit
LIVDIGELKELRGIAIKGETLVIGALTRHADLLKSSDIVKCAALLAAAVAHVAHPAIRNRGTIGGSLAQADPASGIAGLHAGAGRDHRGRGPAASGGLRQRISSPESMRRRLRRRNCWWPSNCRSARKARRISSRSSRGGTAITRLSALPRRRCAGRWFADLRLGYFAVGDKPVLAKAAAS